MKRNAIFFPVLMIAAVYSFCGERPKDFRGMVWGTDISSVEGMVPLQENNVSRPGQSAESAKAAEEVRARKEALGEKVYTRPSDSLRVGSGEMQTIEYCFTKDKLTSVRLRFSDYGAYLAMKSLLSDLYGAPDREENNPMSTSTGVRYDWYAKSDDEANVILFYSRYGNLEFGTIVMKWKASLKSDTGL